MVDTGTTQLLASCFVPGITFHAIRTPSSEEKKRKTKTFVTQERERMGE
jgi:hypothetical protein